MTWKGTGRGRLQTLFSRISLFLSREKSNILSEMAEQTQVTMDNITALKPAMADAEPAADIPPIEQIIEPLDIVEEPKVRTKLRIYSILVALYARYSVLAISEHQLANDTPSSLSFS